MRHLALAIALAAGLPTLAAAAPVLSSLIARAVANPARPDSDQVGDPLRKPAETLAFAGVKPGMVVGEFYPGGGYFTRMISDIVGPKGHVYAIENEQWKGAVEGDKALLDEGRWTNVSIDFQPFGTVNFPQPLDLAWVTQNYHDLKIAEYGRVDTLAFDRAVYKALKPGGIFFILDHQGKPGMTDEAIAKLHRIHKAVVIREVTAAGFRLVGEGRFLHRAGDDHSKPIFDQSIRGHTDQYALKFVKPGRGLRCGRHLC